MRESAEQWNASHPKGTCVCAILHGEETLSAETATHVQQWGDLALVHSAVSGNLVRIAMRSMLIPSAFREITMRRIFNPSSGILAQIAGITTAFACLMGHTAAQAADGSFDATFASGGRTTFALSSGNSDYANATLQVVGGKLLMAGSCSFSGCLAKLNTDGTLDQTYGPLSLGYFVFDNVSGIPHPSNVYDMTILPDGRAALVGCSGDEQTGAIYMVQSDGKSLDLSVGDG